MLGIRPRFTLDLTELRQYLLSLSQLDFSVFAGVAASGPGTAYALVWELGNIRMTKAGPKTVMGHNPISGETAFFSTQAPLGYVRVLVPVFMQIIVNEMRTVQWASANKAVIEKQIKNAAAVITQKMAQLVAQHAPVDTGDLQMSIVPIAPGASLMDTLNTNSIEDVEA